jgi:hypothetical protein
MLQASIISALRPEDLPLALDYDGDLQTGGEVRLLGGPRSVVFQATSYSRAAPRHIGGLADPPALAAYFATLDARFRRLPACVQVELDGLIVRDRTIHLAADDGSRAVYETVRAIDRPYVPGWDQSPANEPEQVLDHPGVTYAYLGSAGSFNYGHWLVDDLPRAAALARMREGLSIVVPSAGAEMDAVRRASLQLILGEPLPPVTFLAPGVRHRLARATYVTPVSHHPVLKHPEAMDYVRSKAVRALGPRRGPPAMGRRLFVVRAEARGRGIVNIAEVSARLAHAGFHTLDPETLSFEQQVEAFSRAEVVIGLMGAAMTNTIFCPAGARVGYLAPEGWTEPFYWDLANVMGHPYYTLFGPPASPDLPPHLSAFSLDVAEVDRLVAAMCDA